MKMTRRRFMINTGLLVLGSALGTACGAESSEESDVVKIGLNIPMTGDYAPWGLPGLYGCEIVAENINANGGVTIGGKARKIEIVGFDHGYDTDKALQGYKKLVLEDKVQMVMMLGGSTVASILPESNKQNMLTSTLLPSDITPDTPNLVAPCETHPLYNVTGVEWLAKNFPDAKTAVICTTNDIEYGQQSAATYQAAFEVAGIEVLETTFHGFDVADFAPIVSSLLALNPDVFCMATDVYTTSLVEQLFHQDFKGKIISCTLDGYQDVIAKTSQEFVEGLIWQFPDFDDPALTSANTNFPDPAGFYQTFEEKHAGEWSAVAWEYPSILISWVEAAEKADSVDPQAVLKAMLDNPTPTHTFKNAEWWGKDLWGRDQAAVGDWPVVTMQNGKATIQEFLSVRDWLEQHSDVLVKHMKAAGLTTV